MSQVDYIHNLQREIKERENQVKLKLICHNSDLKCLLFRFKSFQRQLIKWGLPWILLDILPEILMIVFACVNKKDIIKSLVFIHWDEIQHWFYKIMGCQRKDKILAKIGNLYKYFFISEKGHL